MKAVLQCCRTGSVSIDGGPELGIGRGFVILLGITHTDSMEAVTLLADKCAGLRVFADSEDKLNCSLGDIDGQALVISNFTLYADARKGRRPSYINAARPEQAEPLYEAFAERLRGFGIKVVTGKFGADMLVNIQNDGPVTLVLDTDQLAPKTKQ